ncbi:plasmolipin [Centropristis striata]|uniref:plasmolipin n=1 Tax=Centropristis striata TaxID=184440 RepID=UPI0027DF0405|nr:plasmolipin [Centropristis striata]
MADFPSKVTTETGTPNSQSSQQGGNSLQRLGANISNRVDTSFIRSVPAILMLAEIILGLLHWALIASTPYHWIPAYNWVMFVAVTLWIFTIVLFCLFLFGQQRLIVWNRPLVVMVYYGVASVLYLSAFLANAASVHPYYSSIYYGHFAAAAFFSAVVTIVYGASTFFSYLEWRQDGGNAATNTVPA